MAKSASLIRFPDASVDCYYSFKQATSRQYQFYKSFLLRKKSFTVGDFCCFSEGEEWNLGQLLCIFTTTSRNSNKLKNNAIIKKYFIARNVKSVLLDEGVQKFDDDNEVVEDGTKDYKIDLEQIKHKAFLILCDLSDGPYVVSENNLDPKSYFSCRFRITHKGISHVLEHYKNKTKLKEITPMKDIKNSPHVVLRNFKDLTCNDLNTSSPQQRSLVKRDLNKSFGSPPKKQKENILSYSIISSDDEENLLKIKLKLSKKQPQVILTKLTPEQLPKMVVKKIDNEYCVTPSKKHETPEGVRRSSRRKTEVCYSYEKLFQRLELECEPSNKRKETSVECQTPKKSRRKSSTEETPSRTRQKRTYYYYESISSSDEESQVKTSPKKRSRQLTNTPVAKDPLNTSIRRSILKSAIKGREVSRKTVRSNSVASIVISDEDSDDNKPLKTQTPAKRTLRSNSVQSLEDSEPTKNTTPTKPRKNSFEDFDCDFEPLNIRKSSRRTLRSKSILTEDSEVLKDKRTRRTVRSTSVQSIVISDEDEGIVFSPDKKTKSIKTPSKAVSTPKTPRNRAKLIREGTITPSIQNRLEKVKSVDSPLMRARSQLHVAYVPKALPCREKEYQDVYNFLNGKLIDGCGGCMYISGVPGTGKTATITSVINCLQEDKKIPKFDFVSINGLRLTEPRQSYVEILKQLTKKTVPWEQAQSLLEERFTKKNKNAPCVLLVDELDILCTKRQDVVYNLLDWPTKAKSQLVVLTIANTMDLPERLLMSRVTSRLGLTRLTFQPYTFKQLQEIVSKRLTGTNSFNSDAIQFVSRKVASVSGDARRALDICRRAAEIAEAEGPETLVAMSHVNEALNAMITQPKVRAIKHCTKLEKLLLQAIVAEVERTGVEETTFLDVMKMLVSVAALEGFKMTSNTLCLHAISKLGACRLILTELKSNDFNQKIILNVSSDDVYYALTK